MRIPLVSRPLERAAQRTANSDTLEPRSDSRTEPALPDSQTLSQRALRRRVWALALPAIGEQMLALAVGLSDTFLSGHLSPSASTILGYGRATAIAAVGVAVTVVWIVLTAFFAVNIGVTALVARAT